MPAFHTPAFTLKDQEAISLSFNYYHLFNLLQMPSGIVPVTRVRANEDDNYEDGFNDAITKGIRESVKGSEGLPVGVQIGTPKWKDEECLALMKILEDFLNAVAFKPTPTNYFNWAQKESPLLQQQNNQD